MKNKLRPEIFLFEFATCGGETPDSILVEGLGMFYTIYRDFANFSNVRSFVRSEFKSIFNLPTTKNWRQSFIDCLDSEYALIIAPEDDFLLLNLTKKIEKQNLKNLGSSSKAIRVTSDKWELYKKIKRKVNVPKTSKKPLNDKFIVKPRTSCGGEGIKLVKTSKIDKKHIAQEYIKGRNVSLSYIVGEDVSLLSVNEQIIKDFRYSGAIVPLEIEPKLLKEVNDECIKAIDCIKGLFGYVGVDVILGEIPYIIEINARLTTPSILFKDAYGINLAKIIYDNYYSRVDVSQEKRGCFKLVKEKGNHGFVHARGYSLVKYQLASSSSNVV